jgi:hypothetical protein
MTGVPRKSNFFGASAQQQCIAAPMNFQSMVLFE